VTNREPRYVAWRVVPCEKRQKPIIYRLKKDAVTRAIEIDGTANWLVEGLTKERLAALRAEEMKK
jgi:hypothetical protein